ncbi:MAG: carbon starvation induced protein CsiD [Pelagibacteraceae bacterium]|nr:carbon starvation induced protein CsiD [Pelagibacteraceae bacterium]MCI5079467.1 carbon starvation induced protein CsiD [Pelagibacteraceae bacterium]
MNNITGLNIKNHISSDRLVDIKIQNSYLDKVKEQFDQYELIDIEYKPFLRFHITDIFNKVFDEKIQNIIKKILTDRKQGAFVIGPEKMDDTKYDTDFLVKLSTALTHLVGVPNFDSMYGKYYARFEVKNTDDSDSYLRKAAKKLDLHTDGTYVKEKTDWLLMMKMKEENSEGGESTLLHLDDWEDCDKFFSDPLGQENFIWGSPKSKNVEYKVEHPIFSTDKNGKPIISYIDQFPEPQSLKQGLYLNNLSESLEGSKKHIAFKLPPGYSIFSNNYFMLHGRKAFKPHPKLYRELLRQRGVFYR